MRRFVHAGGQGAAPSRHQLHVKTRYMTDSPDELRKSYEVIRSIVERHCQYDAARILTLNLAACITADSQQDDTAALANLADSICRLCDAVRDMPKDNAQVVAELLKKRRKINLN
jgi:hypothetical protein